MTALKDPRTCRIFFSSPFGGMEGEREELTRRYFPQLHHLCNSKGIQFIAVDMRWGITAEAAKQAQVIKICLRELDRSDLFVGFFGQRYGWHGEHDELLQKTFDEALPSYPFLEKWRGKSVTELEFLHGHLNHPGQLPAVICFRDKAFDDERREEGISTGNKSLVYKYSAEEGSKPLMDDLKSRIKATETQTLGVEMAYKNPKEGAKFMFNAIWKYLTETMLRDVSVEQTTWRQNLHFQHTAILRNRSGLYIGGDEYLSSLNASLQSDNPVVVRGVKGSGKSSLLSTWIHNLQENSNDAIIVYHFVGFADGSTGISNILRRIYAELEHCLNSGVDTDKDTSPKGDPFDIIQHWSGRLQNVMERISTQGRKAVIVIDGLNMVDDPVKVGKPLFWLPDSIPKGLHLVVSSLSTDERTTAELVEKRKFSTLDLLPLTPYHQRELCSKTLMVSGKELDEEQMKRIVAAELTNNPLFLKICMEELCVFGYFHGLDKKIDSLVNSKSVEELFSQYLERLENDYNIPDHDGNLVEQVMCCIALSNNGISETEVMEMFSIPNYAWSPLFFAMNKYLVNRSGVLGFAFDELKTAVEMRYLQDRVTRDRYCQTMIEYFTNRLKAIPVVTREKDSVNTRPCHELPWLYLKIGDKTGLSLTLSNLFVFETLYKLDAYQLLEFWKKTGLSGSEIAVKCIHSYNVLLADHYCDSMEDWKEQKPAVRTILLTMLNCVQQLMDLGKMLEGQEMIVLLSRETLENLEGRMDEGNRIKGIHDLNYTLACLYCDTERFTEAETLHHSVLNYRKGRVEKDGHSPTPQEYRDLATSYHGLAAVKLARQLWDEAEKMFWESSSYNKLVQGNSTEQDADCLMNIGNAHLGKRDFPKALHYFTEAFKEYEKSFFGRLPLNMGNLLTNIAICHRKMKNLEEAEKFYQRLHGPAIMYSIHGQWMAVIMSLEIKVNAVGEEHPSVALAYLNLSTLETFRGDHAKSEEYSRKAFHVYEINHFPDNSREVIMARENLASILACRLQRQEESLQYYWPAFNALVEKEEMSRCLPLLHVEIARYCLEQGRLDDGEKITLAMIGNPDIYCDRNFIHLHYIDSRKPEKPERPPEYTLKHALTIWPNSFGVVSYTAELQTIPEGDLGGLLEMIENYHKATEGKDGDEFFKKAAQWCASAGRKDFLMPVFQLGLKYFPNSKILLTNVIMAMREDNEVVEAIPYAERLYKSSMDELRFQMYAVETVVVAGQFNTGRKYLMEIKNRWQDEEGLPEKVENILGVIDTAEADKDKEEETEHTDKGRAMENTEEENPNNNEKV